jgi:hypothetical protein
MRPDCSVRGCHIPVAGRRGLLWILFGSVATGATAACPRGHPRPPARTHPARSRALAPSSAPNSRSPSPILLAENKRQVSRRPRQLSKVQSAGLPDKGNRPISGAGCHRFAWPISRPERRSSETIYKAVPLPVLLSSRPVGREICQLVVDSPRMIHAPNRPVKGFRRAIFERPLTSTSSMSGHPKQARKQPLRGTRPPSIMRPVPTGETTSHSS